MAAAKRDPKREHLSSLSVAFAGLGRMSQGHSKVSIIPQRFLLMK
jgi:hypothetical protein